MTDAMGTTYEHDPMGATYEEDLPIRIDWQTTRRIAAAWALLLGPTGLVILMIVLAMFFSYEANPIEYLH